MDVQGKSWQFTTAPPSETAGRNARKLVNPRVFLWALVMGLPWLENT